MTEAACFLQDGGRQASWGSSLAAMELSSDEPTVVETLPLGLRAPAPPAPKAASVRGPLLAGERIPGSPYTILRALGQGGMGEIYEAEHGALGTRAAIKVLHFRHEGRADLAVRLRDEARLLGRVCHPNVVEVFDLGTLPDGRPYFAMPALRGIDLRGLLARDGSLPASIAMGLMAQALEGLAAIHAAGVVHRDIKLENLFLEDDGTLQVLDLGVARPIREDVISGALAETSPGTPRTMAPEQCAHGPVDARSDVYATGLALYELCAGRGPFDDVRGNDHALRYAHCERIPERLSRVARQPIGADLDAIVARALAKAPSERFQSAKEMASALRAVLQRCSERASCTLSARRERPRLPNRKVPWGRISRYSLAALVLVALAGLYSLAHAYCVQVREHSGHLLPSLR